MEEVEALWPLKSGVGAAIGDVIAGSMFWWRRSGHL